MIEAQVPEFADGGYWYVMPAEPETVDAPGWTFPTIPGACAWYAQVVEEDETTRTVVVIRSPSFVAVVPPASSDTVNTVLGLSGYTLKPFARTKGL